MGKKEEFIRKYQLDHGRVLEYAERKNYSKWSGRAFGISIILFLIFGLVGGSFTEIQDHFLYDLWAIIIVVLFLGGFISNQIAESRLSKSELSEERIALHEIASAIDEFQSGNLDESATHLAEARLWLDGAETTLLSTERKEQLKRYLDRIDSAKNPKEAVKKTFGEVITVLGKEIVEIEKNPIDKEISVIEQSPYQDRSAFRRFKNDLGETFSHLVFSFWGIVVGSILLGISVANYYDKPTVGAAVPTVVLTIYQIYKNKENSGG
ncbi:YrzE family protein [Halorussus salinus]|uniref:hypothetical protein n=1 Tax=Halorussus salinus TaxID=1364935 RepID=UPI001092A076|nr:hypothetical protein [Halorussus salinus]